MDSDDEARWFVATLIIKSTVADEVASRSCDEQIRLVQATDADTAYRKALHLGEEAEVSYMNVYGAEVRWEFVGLENLEELDEPLRDGIEIRSRLSNCDDPSSLTQSRDNLAVFAARSNPHSSEFRIADSD